MAPDASSNSIEGFRVVPSCILWLSGAVLGPSWGHVEPSWAVLGPSWGRLGAILGRLGTIWGHLEPSRGDLGAILSRLAAMNLKRASYCENPFCPMNFNGFTMLSWAVLGRLGAILGPSWFVLGFRGLTFAFLGLSWATRGALGLSWALLGLSWVSRPLRVPR